MTKGTAGKWLKTVTNTKGDYNLEAYHEFAQVYDLFMDNIPYRGGAKGILGLLKEYRICEGTVLDLG